MTTSIGNEIRREGMRNRRITRVNNVYLLRREYLADAIRLDPFKDFQPCYFHEMNSDEFSNPIWWD